MTNYYQNMKYIITNTINKYVQLVLLLKRDTRITGIISKLNHLAFCTATLFNTSLTK